MPIKEIVMNTPEAASPLVVFQMPVAEIRDAVAANLGGNGMSATDFERIKIPAGGGTAWTLQTLDGEEMVKDLSGIIVAWRDTRAYWSVSMDQSEGNQPPDCSSVDARTGVGNPGGDCHSCALAQFGSDPKGEGQACKLVRQLFFLREENLLPEIVSLPASSIKAARQYFMRLASKAVPCHSVITRISLEKTKNGQGIVYSRATFASGGRLSAEQAAKIRDYAAILKPLLDSASPATGARDGGESDGEVI
jgi:hypothetical protein